MTKFKVGDKVRVNDKSDLELLRRCGVKVGTILTILDVSEENQTYKFEVAGGAFWFFHWRVDRSPYNYKFLLKR